jgi:hypothetical protein
MADADNVQQQQQQQHSSNPDSLSQTATSCCMMPLDLSRAWPSSQRSSLVMVKSSRLHTDTATNRQAKTAQHQQGPAGSSSSSSRQQQQAAAAQTGQLKHQASSIPTKAPLCWHPQQQRAEEPLLYSHR